MSLPRSLARAGADLAGYKRLTRGLYEIEPTDDKPKPAVPPKAKKPKVDAADKPKGPPVKDPNAPLPDKKEPGMTAGSPSRSRKDPLPASGKDLQTRIKEIGASLKKKYGLPRDTGEKPPPPAAPPAEGPAAAMGPASKY